MTRVARGLAATLLLMVCLGACTQQQMRSARDNTLGFFGVARKPAVARVTEPPTAPQPAIAEHEAARLDQVDRDGETGREPEQRPGVLRDVGLIKRQSH